MRFGVILTILLFGLAILLWNDRSGQSFGIDNDSFARIITALPLLLVLSAGIVASRHRFSENLRYALWWVLIAVVLMTGYLFRNDLQAVTDRLAAGLLPGRPVVASTADGQTVVVLGRGTDGHFTADVTVNGQSLRLMVDTGASNVVLRAEDAARLGIDPKSLTYSVTVNTANGEAQAAPVRLREIAIGPIVRTNVRALVTSPGRLDQGLLGMSFLSSLDTVQMRGDELRLIE